ncbi:MAG: hypothetical protein LBQ88_16775 [Treponema sp.]|nr:hypothetical protein [Treponema sp.]
MANNSDWLPGRRADQITLAKCWLTVLATKATAWKVPETEVTELTGLTGDAQSIFNKAMSADRTQAITAQCRAAFEKLTSKLRFIKSHYFLAPPLTIPDFALLLLDAPDTTKSPVPPPTGFPVGTVRNPGPGVVEVYAGPMEGQPPLDPRSNYGFRIYFGVMPPGGGGASVEAATGAKRELMKIPATGDDLSHSRWTRRRKERFDFHGDAGKTVYFCIRYENSKGGEEGEGPWGPMFSAIVT